MDRSLIWTDADQDTGTILAIQAQHPGLTCSRKRTLFPSTVLAAVITVTAKYLSFVGSTMHGGQGWPAPAPCQHEAMAAPTCARALAQEASWARTTPPLFDFSVYRLAISESTVVLSI